MSNDLIMQMLAFFGAIFGIGGTVWRVRATDKHEIDSKFADLRAMIVKKDDESRARDTELHNRIDEIAKDLGEANAKIAGLTATVEAMK